MDVQGLAGVALVTAADRTVVELAGGPRRAGEPAECGPDTLFQIASVSKQFAAATALLLAEVGLLDLDEPVGRWLPDVPAAFAAITTHQLLTHTSGIRHWDEAPGFDAAERLDFQRRLELICAAPLLAAPGRSWRYSSPGYLVLAGVLERAGGRPYCELLTEHVLAPLGLGELVVGVTPTGPDVAAGHRAGEPVPLWDLAEVPGAGDLWASATQLARFARALHGGTLLSPASLHRMRSRLVPRPASPTGFARVHGYGYGLFTGTFGDEPAHFHPGDNPGFQSLLGWLPERELAVVLLLNDEAADPDGLVREVLAQA